MTTVSDTTTPDDLVWAESPTGRAKQITRARLDILRLAGWKEGKEPTKEALLVAPFPSVPLDEADQPVVAEDSSTKRAARSGSAEQKES